MRKFVVSGALLAVGVVMACSSSSKRDSFDGNDDNTIDPTTPGPGLGDSPSSQFGACATSVNQASITPAAMLVALDKSGTMAQASKYASAQQAIVQAIDEPAFDTMSLAILGFPSGKVAGPACVFGLQVDCAVSALPQVPLGLAGTKKSNDPGSVRNDIYKWLVSNSPSPGSGDGNPTWAALDSGIEALQAWPQSGRRILFYITDGGASCASVSNREGYQDGNGCADWEHPDSIVDLLGKAHADPKSSVNTIVVGVPGADSHGENQNVPPYSVRLALSAYAYAGSPETVDPACTGKQFTQSNADPATSCHFDMTSSYSAQALADAIDQIRGKLLGCVFDIPAPADGQTVDLSLVNVTSTTNGASKDLYKRKSPGDACTDCWDYTSDGKIELLGDACQAVKSTADAKVDIVVGCETRVH